MSSCPKYTKFYIILNIACSHLTKMSFVRESECEHVVKRELVLIYDETLSI